jgi:hypothetical protein
LKLTNDSTSAAINGSAASENAGMGDLL